MPRAELRPVNWALREGRNVRMTCTQCWGTGRSLSVTTTTDDGPCQWCRGREEITYDR